MKGPQDDRMTLTVLEDGTARLEIDGISGANHAQADKIVAEFARLMGGELKIEKRKEGHAHRHAGAHQKRRIES